MINWYHYNNGLLRQDSTLQLILFCLNFKMYYHILFGTDLSKYVLLISCTLYILHTSINTPIFTGHKVCIPDHINSYYHVCFEFFFFYEKKQHAFESGFQCPLDFFCPNFSIRFVTKNFHCIKTLCF